MMLGGGGLPVIESGHVYIAVLHWDTWEKCGKGAMTWPAHAEVQVGHDFNNRISLVHIFFQLAAWRCGI